MNLTTKIPKIEVILHPRQIMDLDDRQHRMAIECKSGVIWVTHSGESQDHILSAGRQYISKTKGKIIIEAIGEACLNIEEQ